MLLFLLLQSYIEKEEGKVVVYTTSLGVLRNTFEDCMKVKKILRTLLIKFDEKDVFMSREYQDEIKERMRCDQVLVPQVFVSGQHVGVSYPLLAPISPGIQFSARSIGVVVAGLVLETV